MYTIKLTDQNGYVEDTAHALIDKLSDCGEVSAHISRSGLFAYVYLETQYSLDYVRDALTDLKKRFSFKYTIVKE